MNPQCVNDRKRVDYANELYGRGRLWRRPANCLRRGRNPKESTGYKGTRHFQLNFFLLFFFLPTVTHINVVRQERGSKRETRGTNAQGSLKSIHGIFSSSCSVLGIFAMICTHVLSLSLSLISRSFKLLLRQIVSSTTGVALQGEIYRRFIPHFRFISLFSSLRRRGS